MHVSRRRPGGLAWSQEATGNGRVEGHAEIPAGHVRSPRASSYRWYRPGNLARGKEPSFSQWRSKERGMSDGLTARNGADNVRKLQRALYRASKQDKERRLYSLYDKVWKADILGDAWRRVKANKGAPGGDGKAIEAMVETGQEAAMIQKLQEALRAKHDQCAPVRVVEIPKPNGGTRPLGMATVEDRVVQTAMKLALGPIFEADVHDGSYGYRPQRNARQASLAMQDDLDQRAWGVVERDCKSYFTSIPHRKRLKLSTRRRADGRLLRLMKQTLKVGGKAQGQVMPTTVGVPQGSPISPLYSTI